MRVHVSALWTSIGILAGSAAAAQDSDPATRQSMVEAAQAAKVPTLQPYVQTSFERLMVRVEDVMLNRTVTWHPYFESAAHGGGLPIGAGYVVHVSPYNFVDVRGSYTVSGYKRAEAEFVAPRLFNRRGSLSVIGGWRDATQVAFYGLGPNSSIDDHAHYGFKEGYGSALLTVQPTRRYLMLRGGFEVARWSPETAQSGGVPTVESIYTPATLPGLGATTTFLHAQGTVGFDWRPAPGYARRGGFYGVTAHDYHDRDDRFGYREVDYDVVQHVPILRESWVLSLRGRVETTFSKDGQEVPYYVLPHLGGGSTLRGFDSWRFRDRDKLLLQGEWRIPVNRFMDTALFYDAGKVARRAGDLDFSGLKSDYGFGARFHTPFQTVLRVEVARSHETTRFVVSTTPVF
jgi:surface antigen Omp85-like protein